MVQNNYVKQTSPMCFMIDAPSGHTVQNDRFSRVIKHGGFTASEITLIAFRDYATICHKKENLTLYTGHYFAVGFKVRFGSTVRDM